MKFSSVFLLFTFFMNLFLGIYGCTQNSDTSSSNFYTFPGIYQVQAQPDGTFILNWEKVPANDVTYKIFSRKESGSFNFEKSIQETTETTFRTGILKLSENTCFTVRFVKRGIEPDTNTKEMCTETKKYEFLGISSLSLTSNSTYFLQWEQVPISGVNFAIYEKLEGYNFTSPLAVTTNTNFETKKYALGKSPCFIVRFFKDGIDADENKVEKCVEESPLGNFTGIKNAESNDTGSVDIFWDEAPSNSNYKVAGYNIYVGANFSQLKATSPTGTSSKRILNLIPDELLQFGVRVVDEFGREDSNLKIFPVTVLNNIAPVFAGADSVQYMGNGTAQVSWQAAQGGVNKYKIYAISNTNPTANILEFNLNSPTKEVPATVNSTSITGLGDDTTHHFIVRASVSGGAQERNNIVKSVTFPDEGAPKFLGISEVKIEGGQLKISWEKALGDTKRYAIYSRGFPHNSLPAAFPVTFNPTELLLFAPSTSVQSFILNTNIADNTTYNFAVRAEDSKGAIDTNTKMLTFSIFDLTPPLSPTILGATALNENSINISFSRNLESDVNRYSVRIKPTGSSVPYVENISVANSGTGNISATITGLLGNTEYDIMVHAIDTSGNTSALSSPIVRKTLDLTPPAFTGITKVSKDLSLPASPQVKVEWNTTQDASEYVVYYSLQSFSGVAQADLKKNMGVYPKTVGSQVVYKSPSIAGSQPFTQFTIGGSGLTQGATYYFLVHALDAAGNETNTVAQIPFVVPYTTPPTFNGITGVQLVPGNVSSVILNWNIGSNGVNDYLVYQNSAPNAPVGLPIAILPSSSNFYQVDSLPDFTGYYFIVRARNIDGFEDNNTAEQFYFVPDQTPPTFEGISAVDANGLTQKLDVKFSQATDRQGVKEYHVYWRVLGSNFNVSPDKIVSNAIACSAGNCVVPLGTADGLIANTTYEFKVNAADTQFPTNNIRTTTNTISKLFPNYQPPSPPSNLAISPTPSVATNNTNPTVTGNVAAAGNTVKVYVDGTEVAAQTVNTGTAFSIALNLSTLSDGAKNITAKAFSNLGVPSNSALVAVYPLDTTPPQITIVSPFSPTLIGTTGSLVNTSTLTFVSNESGTYKIFDGIEIASGGFNNSTNKSINLNAGILQAGDGVHNLNLQLTDTAGNITNIPLAITLDTTPPLSPNNFFVVSDEENNETRFYWDNVSLQSTDTLQIRKNTTPVLTPTDGSLLAGNLNSTTISFTQNTTLGYPQQYSVFACDALGNCSNASTCTSCKAGFNVSSSYLNFGVGSQPTQDIAVSAENNFIKFNFTNMHSASVATTRISVANTKSNLQNWRGEAQVSAPSGNTIYTVSNSSSIAPCTVASCEINLSTANGGAEYPPWTNLFYRVGLHFSSNNSTILSRVRRWAQVPPEMVFVAKEDWPQNIPVAGSNPTIVESYPVAETYDFAIDKFEASRLGKTSGTQQNVSFGTAFPNASNNVLVSTADVPDYGNWWGFAQGCLNRSYSGAFSSFANTTDLSFANKGVLQTPNPSRKFRLPLGTEFTVAAYGTPDISGEGNCNTDNRGSPASAASSGVNNNSSCNSNFGSKNLIGNVWEWTQEMLLNGKGGSWQQWIGTLAIKSLLPNNQVPTNTGNTTGTWDFRRGFRNNFSNTALTGYIYSMNEDGNFEGGEEGKGWAAFRGGSWYNEIPRSGRFASYIEYSPSFASSTTIGGRCVISAPSESPVLLGFGSEATPTQQQLHFNFNGVESTTNIRVGRAVNEADLISWNGSATSNGVNVTSTSINSSGLYVGGSCEGSYTPSAGTLFTGKFCEAPSGASYYKVCAVNPAINGVQGAASCSPVKYFTGANSPTLEPIFQSGRATLQNDSVGNVAAFFWKSSGGTNINYRLAYSQDIDDIKNWRGMVKNFGQASDINIGVGTVLSLQASATGTSTASSVAGSARATCKNIFGTGNHYSPPASLADGTDYTDYACLQLSALPKWAKVFFRLGVASANTSGTPSGFILSNVNAAGHVPEGMVLVARELWPSATNGNAVDEYPESTVLPCVMQTSGYPSYDYSGSADTAHKQLHNCRYDFAIDKYEAYTASGSYNANEFSTAGKVANTDWIAANNQATNSNNTTNAVLKSAKNHAEALTKLPTVYQSWYAFKKACENRTSDASMTGFVGSNNALVKPRLPTGTEWTLSALETPDLAAGDNTFCHINYNPSSASAGSSWGKCMSRFGTLDQIGNVWEYTDEVTFDKSNFMRFYGTTQNSQPLGSQTLPTIDGWYNTWNYMNGFISSINGSSLGDFFASLQTQTTAPAHGGWSGAGWSAVRGGGWNFDIAAGRFALGITNSPVDQYDDRIGGRCAITAP
jgi:formylglycine-generating enzyme required for sulfatase activity